MAFNLNQVAIVGNLGRDPELKHRPDGTAVCSLWVAVGGAGGKQDDGTYAPGWFGVTVFGNQAEACSQYLEKGRPVAVGGRLSYREWEDRDTGKRQRAVEIVASTVQFLGSRQDGDGGGGRGGDDDWREASRNRDAGDFGAPAATPSQFVPATGPDGDIPF